MGIGRELIQFNSMSSLNVNLTDQCKSTDMYMYVHGVLIVITVLIVSQYLYESMNETFYGTLSQNERFIYSQDITRSEAGRPITEIIVNFAQSIDPSYSHTHTLSKN